MSETNEYGNSDMRIGVGFNLDGVHLYVEHPESGEPVRVMQIEPDFARRIAESLTLRSFECDDARKAAKEI